MKSNVEKRGRTWRYRIELRPEEMLDNWKQVISKSGFTKESDAKRAMRKVLAEIEEGQYVKEQNLTVKNFLFQWLDHYESNVAASTIKRYRELMNTVIKYIGNKEIQKVKPYDIQVFYDSLVKNKVLSNATIVKIHRVLNMALRKAIVWGIIKSNPCNDIKPPRAVKVEMHCWTEKELKTFLRAYKDGQFYLQVAIAAGTGMRLGEICGLKWDCVDLKNGEITVRRSLRRINKVWYLKQPKTASSIRTIPIAKDLQDILTLHKKRQDKLIKENDKYINENYVCAWEDDGRPYNPDYISKHFHIQLKEYDVPLIRFHDIRHTHATVLLLHDVPVKVVSERLGHASISITLDTYTHVLPNMQKEAAEKLQGLFSGAL